VLYIWKGICHFLCHFPGWPVVQRVFVMTFQEFVSVAPTVASVVGIVQLQQIFAEIYCSFGAILSGFRYRATVQ
jgi:hypothetical protein